MAALVAASSKHHLQQATFPAFDLLQISATCLETAIEIGREVGMSEKVRNVEVACLAAMNSSAGAAAAWYVSVLVSCLDLVQQWQRQVQPTQFQMWRGVVMQWEESCVDWARKVMAAAVEEEEEVVVGREYCLKYSELLVPAQTIVVVDASLPCCIHLAAT